MDSKKKNKKEEIVESKTSVISKQIKEVSPWAERIGIYLIALMTFLGSTLIIYTGIKAFMYDESQEIPELLSHDDIALNNGQNSEDLMNDQEDEEGDQDQENEDADNDDEQPNIEDEPTTFIGIANTNKVNVRDLPEANETVSILVQLPEGAEILVIDSNYNENWMQVEYNNEIGYVSKEFIDRIE